MRPPATHFASIATLLAAITGCFQSSSDLYPVSGIVRFPDGKILRDGTVEFELTGQEQPVTSTSTIGPDGSFVLGTFTADDGAPVGKHRVVVVADYVIGNGAERPGLIPPSPLHSKYRSFDTSKLVFEVKPQTNNFVIEVEYADSTEDGDQEGTQSAPPG